MNIGPLLKFIRSHEAPKGYNQVWGGIRKEHLPKKPITTMTIGQLLAWQDSIDRLYNSEAAGAYQIMEDTLRASYSSAGFTTNDKFDEETQDALAIHLLRGRGLGAFLRGEISVDQFCNSIAKEWASLPVVTPVRRTAKGKSWVVPAGASYYSGDGLNKSLTKVEPFRAVVRDILTPAARVPVTRKPSSEGGSHAKAVKQTGAGVGVTALALSIAVYWDNVKEFFNWILGG